MDAQPAGATVSAKPESSFSPDLVRWLPGAQPGAGETSAIVRKRLSRPQETGVMGRLCSQAKSTQDSLYAPRGRCMASGKRVPSPGVRGVESASGRRSPQTVGNDGLQNSVHVDVHDLPANSTGLTAQRIAENGATTSGESACKGACMTVSLTSPRDVALGRR
jgi:hypothetical protein